MIGLAWRGYSLVPESLTKISVSAKRAAVEKSPGCVSSTAPFEASIARTIKLPINSDDNQAAEAEQLSTPSPVARLRENTEAFRYPVMNIFRILGTAV
jgi:hypothetical protein